MHRYPDTQDTGMASYQDSTKVCEAGNCPLLVARVKLFLETWFKKPSKTGVGGSSAHGPLSSWSCRAVTPGLRNFFRCEHGQLVTNSMDSARKPILRMSQSSLIGSETSARLAVDYLALPHRTRVLIENFRTTRQGCHLWNQPRLCLHWRLKRQYILHLLVSCDVMASHIGAYGVPCHSNCKDRTGLALQRSYRVNLRRRHQRSSHCRRSVDFRHEVRTVFQFVVLTLVVSSRDSCTLHKNTGLLHREAAPTFGPVPLSSIWSRCRAPGP